MLWCTSGVAEFWSLTIDERKRLLEMAIEEGRATNPDIVIQACTAAMSAKDCLELTQHAQQAGADIVYIQTPMMEAHGGEGVLSFFRYIADRTDIALGMFNSPSSGYVLTPAESARIYDEIPAVCATKEGAFRPGEQPAAARAGTRSVDLGVRPDGVPRGLAARRDRVSGAAGHGGYLHETPQRPIFSEYWDLIWNDKLIEAMDYARESGLDQFEIDMGSWFTCYPGRPDYFTHWGGAFKYAASLLGLPVGDYPAFAAAAGELPEEAKTQIRDAYRRFGLVGSVGPPAALRKALPIGVQYVHTSQLEAASEEVRTGECRRPGALRVARQRRRGADAEPARADERVGRRPRGQLLRAARPRPRPTRRCAPSWSPAAVARSARARTWVTCRRSRMPAPTARPMSASWSASAIRTS